MSYSRSPCKIEMQRENIIKIYSFNNNLTLKTTETIKNYVAQALENVEPVFRLKSPTFLSTIVYNYIESTAINPMQNIRFGVTKKLICFLV